LVNIDVLQCAITTAKITLVISVNYVIHLYFKAFEKTLRSSGLRSIVSPGIQQRARDRSDEGKGFFVVCTKSWFIVSTLYKYKPYLVVDCRIQLTRSEWKNNHEHCSTV